MQHIDVATLLHLSEQKRNYVKCCYDENLPAHPSIVDLFRQAENDPRTYVQLNLSACALNDQDILPLIMTLVADPMVREIDLSRNDLHDCAPFFLLFERKQLALTKLILTHNPLQKEPLTELLNFVQEYHPNVQIIVQSKDNSRGKIQQVAVSLKEQVLMKINQAKKNAAAAESATLMPSESSNIQSTESKSVINSSSSEGEVSTNRKQFAAQKSTANNTPQTQTKNIAQPITHHNIDPQGQRNFGIQPPEVPNLQLARVLAMPANRLQQLSILTSERQQQPDSTRQNPTPQPLRRVNSPQVIAQKALKSNTRAQTSREPSPRIQSTRSNEMAAQKSALSRQSPQHVHSLGSALSPQHKNESQCLTQRQTRNTKGTTTTTTTTTATSKSPAQKRTDNVRKYACRKMVRMNWMIELRLTFEQVKKSLRLQNSAQVPVHDLITALENRCHKLQYIAEEVQTRRKDETYYTLSQILTALRQCTCSITFEDLQRQIGNISNDSSSSSHIQQAERCKTNNTQRGPSSERTYEEVERQRATLKKGLLLQAQEIVSPTRWQSQVAVTEASVQEQDTSSSEQRLLLRQFASQPQASGVSSSTRRDSEENDPETARFNREDALGEREALQISLKNAQKQSSLRMPPPAPHKSGVPRPYGQILRQQLPPQSARNAEKSSNYRQQIPRGEGGSNMPLQQWSPSQQGRQHQVHSLLQQKNASESNQTNTSSCKRLIEYTSNTCNIATAQQQAEQAQLPANYDSGRAQFTTSESIKVQDFLAYTQEGGSTPNTQQQGCNTLSNCATAGSIGGGTQLNNSNTKQTQFSSPFNTQMNISAIKMSESGCKNVTLSEIANELLVLGGVHAGKMEDTCYSRLTDTLATPLRRSTVAANVPSSVGSCQRAVQNCANPVLGQANEREEYVDEQDRMQGKKELTFSSKAMQKLLSQRSQTPTGSAFKDGLFSFHEASHEDFLVDDAIKTTKTTPQDVAQTAHCKRTAQPTLTVSGLQEEVMRNFAYTNFGIEDEEEDYDLARAEEEDYGRTREEEEEEEDYEGAYEFDHLLMLRTGQPHEQHQQDNAKTSQRLDQTQRYFNDIVGWLDGADSAANAVVSEIVSQMKNYIVYQDLGEPFYSIKLEGLQRDAYTNEFLTSPIFHRFISEIKGLKLFRSGLDARALQSLLAPKSNSLKLLNLSYNSLQDLTFLGSGTPCLEFLNVEGNCLRELCGLDAAINVREIYAAHNQIEIVYGVQNMKCLKVLDLENNRIARFDQIMSLSANPLELVNLLQNEIVHLPNYRRTLISILPSLKGTDISDPKSLSDFSRFSEISFNDRAELARCKTQIVNRKTQAAPCSPLELGSPVACMQKNQPTSAPQIRHRSLTPRERQKIPALPTALADQLNLRNKENLQPEQIIQAAASTKQKSESNNCAQRLATLEKKPPILFSDSKRGSQQSAASKEENFFQAIFTHQLPNFYNEGNEPASSLVETYQECDNQFNYYDSNKILEDLSSKERIGPDSESADANANGETQDEESDDALRRLMERQFLFNYEGYVTRQRSIQTLSNANQSPATLKSRSLSQKRNRSSAILNSSPKASNKYAAQSGNDTQFAQAYGSPGKPSQFHLSEPSQDEVESGYGDFDGPDDQDQEEEPSQLIQPNTMFYQREQLCDGRGRVFNCQCMLTGRYFAIKTYTGDELANYKIDTKKLRRILDLQNRQCLYVSCIQKVTRNELNGIDLHMEQYPLSLATQIKSSGTFNDQLTRVFARQLLLGLQELHNRDIVHGNLKASNILIDVTGKLKLSDPLIFQLNFSTISLIRSRFSAPETLLHNQVTLASDIWSVGMIVLEMRTGKTPWLDKHGHQLALEDITERMYKQKMFQLPPQLDKKLKKFLHKALRPNPHNRPALAMLLNHEYIREIAEEQMSFEKQLSQMQNSHSQSSSSGQSRNKLQLHTHSSASYIGNSQISRLGGTSSNNLKRKSFDSKRSSSVYQLNESHSDQLISNVSHLSKFTMANNSPVTSYNPAYPIQQSQQQQQLQQSHLMSSINQQLQHVHQPQFIQTHQGWVMLSSSPLQRLQQGQPNLRPGSMQQLLHPGVVPVVYSNNSQVSTTGKSLHQALGLKTVQSIVDQNSHAPKQQSNQLDSLSVLSVTGPGSGNLFVQQQQAQVLQSQSMSPLMQGQNAAPATIENMRQILSRLGRASITREDPSQLSSPQTIPENEVIVQHKEKRRENSPEGADTLAARQRSIRLQNNLRNSRGNIYSSNSERSQQVAINQGAQQNITQSKVYNSQATQKAAVDRQSIEKDINAWYEEIMVESKQLEQEGQEEKKVDSESDSSVDSENISDISIKPAQAVLTSTYEQSIKLRSEKERKRPPPLNELGAPSFNDMSEYSAHSLYNGQNDLLRKTACFIPREQRDSLNSNSNQPVQSQASISQDTANPKLLQSIQSQQTNLMINSGIRSPMMRDSRNYQLDIENQLQRKQQRETSFDYLIENRGEIRDKFSPSIVCRDNIGSANSQSQMSAARQTHFAFRGNGLSEDEENEFQMVNLTSKEQLREPVSGSNHEVGPKSTITFGAEESVGQYRSSQMLRSPVSVQMPQPLPAHQQQQNDEAPPFAARLLRTALQLPMQNSDSRRQSLNLYQRQNAQVEDRRGSLNTYLRSKEDQDSLAAHLTGTISSAQALQRIQEIYVTKQLELRLPEVIESQPLNENLDQ